MCEDVTDLNYATEHGMEIDHSHETGEIRCITKCNNSQLGLGCIDYLRYLKAAGRTRGSWSVERVRPESAAPPTPPTHPRRAHTQAWRRPA